MSAAVSLGPTQIDYEYLTRDLDRTKSAAFSGSNAAFLGSLLCSMDFSWSTRVPTAATNGVKIIWNPEFFTNLLPETRQTVLLHELWHPGRLHFIRMGSRDPLIWNYATDIRINNDLEDDGYSFKGIEWVWKDHSYPKDMAEEDIYDDLVKNGKKPPTPLPFSCPQGQTGMPVEAQGDILPVDPNDKTIITQGVNNVVRAIQQAKATAGSVPGDIETILNRFLKPVVPWQQVLSQFMKELSVEDYSWQRPNRRYSNLYLPSRYQDEGRLTHLVYFEDVSGSISDEDAVRFNSEFKYVHDTFRPPKMDLVQFDTQITQELHYGEDDSFNQVKIIGRGGTSLVPVREYIIKHRPTAAIIFSDLECAPMEPLPFQIPVIWVAIRNQLATVPFGKLIHIR